MIKPLFTSREGWFLYYSSLFSKTGMGCWAQMALWHMLMALQDDEEWCHEFA